MLDFLWRLFFNPLVLVPLVAFFGVFGLFSFLVLAYIAFFRIQGLARPLGVHVKPKKRRLLVDLFWRAPMQFAFDYLNRSPEFFRDQGLIVYTGRQGNGKTIAMVEQAMRWQQEYPKVKVISNLDYKYQDEKLEHWSQLMDYKNGIQGVVVLMDELQNWFSSGQSRNFPPEMLQVITQNRKNRRVIQGTSQSFVRLAKPIREQTTEVRRCWTFAGCFTVVHRVEPVLKADGEVDRWLHRGFYYFVHDQHLRDSYDTWAVVEALSKSGFKPVSEQLRDSGTSVRVRVDRGKK